MTRIVIKKLSAFSKKEGRVFGSEDLEKLCAELIQDPYKGDVIRGTDGCRKIRARIGNIGKSGGARVIYFYWVIEETIYLMACYAKSGQADISPQVKKQLKKNIEQLKLTKKEIRDGTSQETRH